METPPPFSPDCRAYLLIELLADGRVNIYLQGDPVVLHQYLQVALADMAKQAPREAA